MRTVRLRRSAPAQGSSLHGCRPNSGTAPSDLEQVLAYHERTKHRPERYAPGPETLDWSSQPDPFRCFTGAPRVSLPPLADQLTAPYSSLHQPNAIPPQPLTLDSVGLLFELSLGLSAWKEYGPDRWAVRCNPSSGNLHPTEGYLISRGLPGLEDGVYHYLSRDHALEQRCVINAAAGDGITRAAVGLSSIHWREAWKYGERAFRYCQLDVGHALGALRYAAAALGWRLDLLEQLGWRQIAGRMGLDRDQDFSDVEPEEAELLLEVSLNEGQASAGPASPEPWGDRSACAVWAGRANVLDPHPMYHWPVIDEVSQATRTPALTSEPAAADPYPPGPGRCTQPASELIRQRRSAQRLDARFEMGLPEFYDFLDTLLPRPTPPWDVWRFSPRLHPVFFVHRVAGLAPGLYILPRRAAAERKLRSALHRTFIWSKPPDCPEHLPFLQLAEGSCEQLARTISCHQAIASDGAFALGMLAEFEETVAAAPWRYRQLHWEAGLLGQALYLEAEALGLRGTGIGCYFDDAFHQLLGLCGTAFQSIYHFTVGLPLTDTRILTLPPYPNRPC